MSAAGQCVGRLGPLYKEHAQVALLDDRLSVVAAQEFDDVQVASLGSFETSSELGLDGGPIYETRGGRPGDDVRLAVAGARSARTWCGVSGRVGWPASRK